MTQRRTCDSCGEAKALAGGVTCSSGHFICSQCRKIKGFFMDSTRATCPLCKEPLR